LPNSTHSALSGISMPIIKTDDQRAVEFVRREYPKAEGIETQVDKDGSVFVRFRLGGKVRTCWYTYRGAR
jgi:hypothetical protein